MIQLRNLTLARGGEPLIEGAGLQIHPGWKVGLTGANGCGKSSFFALMRGEQTLVGCVYLPRLGECFTAAADQPARLNGETIRVSSIASFDEAMILSGLGKPSGANGYALDRLVRVANRAQKTRVMGSAANDICMVACGRAEAYIDDGIHLWDYAAAALILQRAGGTFEVTATLEDGRKQCLSTNGLMHADVKAML